MSAHDAHAGHGHGHGKDHVPHVSPLSLYIKTWLGLMVLTVITVAVSQVDLGTTTNLIIAMLIATVKAGVVAALFMHLTSDKKFHTVILLSSVVFLAIFVIFTKFDTDARGRAEAIEQQRPHDSAKPWEAKPKASAVAPAPAAPAAH
jgi:cytochrome c oxidase subunit 4